MHLGMSKSKNSTSLYVLKSTYHNGFHSTKIVEKLGTVEELSRKLNGQDPIVWAKEHIKELNALEKEEKGEVMAKYSPVRQIEKGQQRTFNGGYLFLQKCYVELGLPQLMESIRRRYHLDYSLDAVFSRLVYARLLHLTDEDYYRESQLLIEQPNFTSEKIAASLEIIAREADNIRTHLYRNTRRLFGPGQDRLFYTSSICLYESSHMEGVYQKVIPMELYYDSNSIPIGYTINPTHEAEPRTTAAEKDIRRSFDGVPAISIGDAGYTSGASPTFRDWSSLNKYMTIVPYAKFNDAEKQQASDPARWHCTDQEGTFNLEELRTGSEAGHLSRCYYKDLCNDSQRTILVYSIYQMEQILAQRAFNASHGSLMKIRENSSDELIGGITAIVTNILDVDAPELISLYNMRTDDLERCRILSMEADEINEDLTLDESIRAHFIICFSANVVFASLMHKMNSRGEGRDVAQQLRDMQFMKIQSEGYVPLYTRSDLTDRLHEAIGFRTDYEIISTRQMNRLVRNKL